MKSLAEKSGTLEFDKGPKHPSLHPPILKVYVKALGNFLSIYLSSLLSPEFLMDPVWYVHHYIKCLEHNRVSVISYSNENTTVFIKILEAEMKVWQLKRDSFKVILKVYLCEVSFSLNVRLSICSHK